MLMAHLHPAPTGCPFESGCTVLLLHKDVAFFTLYIHNMPTFSITPRTSDAVTFLQVDPFNGVAYVTFANGYEYEYTNVSRRAIMNLLLNPNMSLGFWVNNNCVNTKRTSYLQLV